MGPRPADFDEAVIRQSPTFLKWLSLEAGEKMRYACREFVKGSGQDEERLMRRIMIARRNNLRDHEVLKRARKQNHHTAPAATAPAASEIAVVEATVAALYPTSPEDNQDAPVIMNDPAVPPFEGLNIAVISSSNQLSDSGSVPSNPNSVTGVAPLPTAATDKLGGAKGAGRRATSNLNDQQVEREMDVAAVEATRSYRAWMELPEGHEMIYNQKYVKGQPGHDWLLRKNIWRRMRYRRDCKRMVDALRTGGDEGPAQQSDEHDGTSDAPQHPGGPASLSQAQPSRSTNAASRSTNAATKRKPRSQNKRQKKGEIYPPHRESQHSHLNMDSMDDPHESLNDAHESTSLDQLLDESTNKIVQSVKVGLLDATTLMTSTDGSQLLMSSEAESIRLNHHHAMEGRSDEDAVDQEAIEAAVAAAESFGKTAHILAESMASMHHHSHHHNAPSVGVGQEHHHDQPLDAAALDAAAQLAAAAALNQDGDDADAVAAATAAAVAASTSELYETAVNMV
jgi:hypothetical protein